MDGNDLKKIKQILGDALANLPEEDTGGQSPGNEKQLWTQINRLSTDLVERLAALQPIKEPRAFFDPADPRLFGVFAALALVGQDRHPLDTIGDRPFYGSGVYAIYYRGDFAPYGPISGTEHPIYVGKADPARPHARTAREQDTRLWGRLREHRKTIESAGANLTLTDFECRYLVIATGWQEVAERALIGMFQPVWNKETNILLGFGKHGDSAETRRNTRSPWDTLHPGRGWAYDTALEDRRSAVDITARVAAYFTAHPPIADASTILHALMESVGKVE